MTETRDRYCNHCGGNILTECECQRSARDTILLIESRPEEDHPACPAGVVIALSAARQPAWVKRAKASELPVKDYSNA